MGLKQFEIDIVEANSKLPYCKILSALKVAGSKIKSIYAIRKHLLANGLKVEKKHFKKERVKVSCAKYFKNDDPNNNWIV